MRCIILPKALDDLTGIGQYISLGNAARAESFVQEIERCCFDLAKMPGMGKARPEIYDNLRSMMHGAYIIFYSVHTDEIHIEHVIHSARDIENYFHM